MSGSQIFPPLFLRRTMREKMSFVITRRIFLQSFPTTPEYHCLLIGCHLQKTHHLSQKDFLTFSNDQICSDNAGMPSVPLTVSTQSSNTQSLAIHQLCLSFLPQNVYLFSLFLTFTETWNPTTTQHQDQVNLCILGIQIGQSMGLKIISNMQVVS